MSFTLTKDQALRLAQIHVSTTRGVDRPNLARVELTTAGDTMRAVATDSKRLTLMTFDGHGHIDDHEAVVHARQLCDAIVMSFKATPAQHKDEGVVLSLDKSGTIVKVYGDWPESPVFFAEDNTGASTFPNYTSLFKGGAVDGRKRFDNPNYGQVPDGATLPAFDHSYLADMAKLVGTTVRLRDDMYPWQLTYVTADDPGKGNMRPWCFATRDKRGSMGITYLLMPVRNHR